MSEKPLISIIVPIYNVELYLRRCVDSILNQTYPNIEILLINDGSSDNCWEICQEYESKYHSVRVFKKNNGGQSSARNFGLDQARGEYVGFIDSDDWISPDMYEYLYGLIDKFQADLSQCNYMLAYNCDDLPNKKKVKEKVIRGRNNILEYYMRSTTSDGCYSVCVCLIRTRFAQKYKFREGKINEDIDYKYKVYSDCNTIAVSDKICYFYFQSGNSTSSGKLKRKDFELAKAAEELRLLTDKEFFGHIRLYGQVKVARTAFSLLCKIAYYGVGDDIENPRKLIKELTKEHRSNVGILLKAPIPISRKVLAILLAVNINLVRIPLNILKLKL